MSAYGMHILMKANKFSYLADLIGTISLEAFDGRIEPFNELIHFIRPHKGQITTASRVKEFWKEVKLSSKRRYRIRIHFVAFHKFMALQKMQLITFFKTEINSVTDNPNIYRK
jgi:histidine ammonia-lyase